MSLIGKAGWVGKKFLRLLFYPVIRPIEGIGQASAELSRTVREAKARLAEQAEADGGARDYKPGDLRAIRDPRVRFEEFARQRELTAEQCMRRYTTFRVAKFGLFLVSATLLVGGGIVSFFFVPLILEAVSMGFALLGASIAVVKAIEMDLYSVQLRDRALYSFPQYLSRPDFLRHLLRG